MRLSFGCQGVQHCYCSWGQHTVHGRRKTCGVVAVCGLIVWWELA
jgi:hypothetical protein